MEKEFYHQASVARKQLLAPVALPLNPTNDLTITVAMETPRASIAQKVDLLLKSRTYCGRI